MSTAWLQFLAYLGLLLALSVPLGAFIARILQGERTFLHPILAPVERGLLRLMGVQGEEMGWKAYATAILLFNLGGPDDLASVEPFLVNLFSDREIIELPFGAAMQPLWDGR